MPLDVHFSKGRKSGPPQIHSRLPLTTQSAHHTITLMPSVFTPFSIQTKYYFGQLERDTHSLVSPHFLTLLSFNLPPSFTHYYISQIQ